MSNAAIQDLPVMETRFDFKKTEQRETLKGSVRNTYKAICANNQWCLRLRNNGDIWVRPRY